MLGQLLGGALGVQCGNQFIEIPAELGDFVGLTFIIDPRLQVAGANGLHGRGDLCQTAGNAARAGQESDGKGEHAERQQ